MSVEPPQFQESARCDVCNCSFNTFRRRHHCRCCGRTLCHEHSSNQMALPQFGIYSNVRVCADCFNNSGSGKPDPQVSSDGTHTITNAFSKLDIDAHVNSKIAPTAESKVAVGIKECKCGMPLCICEAPAPSSDEQPQQHKKKITPVITPPSNPKPKKSDVPKSRSSTSNSKFSSFNLGHVSRGASDSSLMDYEATGEGLREAIKNGDAASVRKLLNQGVDANYRDKQGLSLLHLAAVFNQTDIVFILMDAGASLEYKNAQGETPLDCAPATLQYKMQKKMEESKATDAQSK
ncbi:vacuolar protein sorting-associated protein 27-like isoform X1 [Neltuma alba]|uniref:vacuolar protein sorting-associated protein 27-like isoform X1 n=1 Tax=Neltuma alba TaxID=207710 RepID=UPI0010A3012E|nr:vacuolar protein sorting-associated protein 27-like isoform X1 [Prosopis alba]